MTKINTRVDLLGKRGPTLLPNALAVYFYYLIHSKRNPSGAEDYRYLYLKDISKKEMGEKLHISQPTIRRAEAALEKVNYIVKDAQNNVFYFPDSTAYVWLPLETMEFFIKLIGEGFEDAGLLTRLYAILYYYRKEKQSFNARTWVYAFGMDETYSLNYLRIHICLFILGHYKLISYDLKEVRARGGKLHKFYDNVKIAEDGVPVDVDESSDSLASLVELYSQTAADFVIDKETGELLA